MLRKGFLAVFLLLLVDVIYLAGKGEADLPPLQNGDIIFQTSWTSQSLATGFASHSLYLHTGIVELTPEGAKVIEAANVVRETPLHDWIEHGIWQRFALYRYEGLTTEQQATIVQTARAYDGTPYDYYFSPGDDSIYCSELDYLAYKAAGLELGKFYKIADLNIDNRFVKELIKKRWQGYPQCKNKDMTFEQCYDIILQGSLLTPAAVADDPHLVKLFSNYPL